MSEDIPRPDGAAPIIIHTCQTPLKSSLISSGCLVLVAVAWAGSGLWRQPITIVYPPTVQATYVLMTVVTDHPVTITPTPTGTMADWERTAEADVTARAALAPTSTYEPGSGGGPR
jgi:hypothetical protein